MPLIELNIYKRKQMWSVWLEVGLTVGLGQRFYLLHATTFETVTALLVYSGIKDISVREVQAIFHRIINWNMKSGLEYRN